MNTRLLLPLHYYDDAGRVLPPKLFHWVSFWGCRALIITASAIMLGPQGDVIVQTFYPQGYELVSHFCLGLGYLCMWLVIGRREWFWSKGYSLGWLRTAHILLLSIDIIAQLAWIQLSGGAFSMVKGLVILITLSALTYVTRSKHVKIMVNDWR